MRMIRRTEGLSNRQLEACDLQLEALAGAVRKKRTASESSPSNLCGPYLLTSFHPCRHREALQELLFLQESQIRQLP
jgi:hypothetical protein